MSEEKETGWFVVRTKPKSEHIAALHLTRYADVEEVFSPRIKYEKGTRRGKVWFVEALFPCYIFARFDLDHQLRNVNATNGVLGVLRFSDKYPTISNQFIAELQAEFPETDKEIRIINQPLEEGDEVMVLDGAMAGFTTVVTRIMSGKERVRVLMDWLGQEREAEVCFSSISPIRQVRHNL